MGWLTRDDDVLAAAEVVTDRRRRRALLAAEVSGAIVVRPAGMVHTLGRLGLDVAWCDGDMTVVAVRCLPAGRFALAPPRGRCAVVARAGAFEQWHLSVGDRLEISG